VKTSGTFNWSTWITSFKFPGCGTTTTPDFSISANPATLNIVQGASDTSTISTSMLGTSGTVALSASVTGPGSGVSASFNPASVTAGSGSIMTVTASGSAPAGQYTVTVTGTEGSVAHTTSVTVNVSTSGTATVPDAPILSAGPANGKGVQLSWNVPLDGGSPITGYVVYRSTSSRGETVLITLGTQTSYKDTATSRGTLYFYQVAATNAIGPGALSTETSATAK